MFGYFRMFFVPLLLLSPTTPLAVAQDTADNAASPAVYLPKELEEFAREMDSKFPKSRAELTNETDPLVVYGDRLLELARGEDGNVSFIASCCLIEWGYGTEVDPQYKFMLEGMKLIRSRHRDNPHLSAAIRRTGGGGIPEVENEEFLRSLLKESKNPTVKAAAALQLAALLEMLGRELQANPNVEKLVAEGVTSVNGLDWSEEKKRSAIQAHKTLIRAYAGRNGDEMVSEAKQLLESIVHEFPDERRSYDELFPWTKYRTLPRVYRSEASFPTYGELAKKRLLAMQSRN